MSSESSYKVFVAGPVNVAVITLLKKIGFVGTNDLMDAHLCVFTGGADISPSLYAEDPIPECGNPNEARDAHERKVFDNCMDFGIPMLGICRGAQLLNVMNGGTLWQHVDGHVGSDGHFIIDSLTGRVVEVTSTHHQMMRPADRAEVLAVAWDESPKSLCSFKKCDGLTQYPSQHDTDPEVVWYEDTQSLCVQFHPEYGQATPESVEYFKVLVYDLLVDPT